MPTGAADEAIFGSPDLSDFCPPENSGESFALQPTDAKTQIFQSQWPAANSDALSAFAVQTGGGAAAHSGASSAGFSEQAGSGDEEDILDLISSSLDRFNAQLHRNHQASIPIPVNHSVLPLWTSSTASNNLQQHLHHSQLNQVQGSSINVAYSALSNASPSTSTGVFCGSSNSSSALLHQPPMPSPPGLSRLSQQTPITGCLKMQSGRKQRNLTQALSYPEEKSYLPAIQSRRTLTCHVVSFPWGSHQGMTEVSSG
uniref:Growth-regulating factor n=1 Tax=Mesocestoides corti TaxID=53468 RepID=A0A5K3F6M5_MESCO